MAEDLTSHGDQPGPSHEVHEMSDGAAFIGTPEELALAEADLSASASTTQSDQVAAERIAAVEGALYWAGHRAGYQDAIRQIWEAQHTLPDHRHGPEADERRRLGELADDLRRAYHRVRDAALAAELAMQEEEEAHHG